MRITILVLLLFSVLKSTAQDFRTLIPFKYENKWGVMDSSAVEVVKPQFNSINIFDEFSYAEFDGEIIYNLKSGESFPAFGEYITSLEIEGVDYHLFTNSKQSSLISFEKKDTISLSLKYRYMYTVDFYDTEAVEPKKMSALIIGYLADNTILFLKNNKELDTFIPTKFSDIEIELIEKDNDKIVGFAVKKDGYLWFYDHNLNVVKKIVNPKGERYDLLPESVNNQLSSFYKLDHVSTNCFTCESVWDNTWSLENELTNNISDNPNNNNFYLSYVSKGYLLNSSKDSDFKLEVRLYYLDYPNRYKTIEIRNTNSLFFYEPKYMNAKKIMFPEQYLIQNK